MKNAILVIITTILFGSTLACSAEELTKEQKTVAITILGEARGEGEAGMYAIGCVIEKRSTERKLTLAQVCRQEWQFSCWNKGNEKYISLMERILKADTKEAKYAKLLARGMTAGNLDQTYTGYANHYCTLDTHNKWTKKGTLVKVIGNHKFFILLP